MDTPNRDKAVRAHKLLDDAIQKVLSSDGRYKDIVVRMPVNGMKLGEPTLSVAEESR